MTPFEEALSMVRDASPRLESEEVGLPEAAGRILAETVLADLDSPPFDTTAMDGWAVVAAEVSKRPLEAAGPVGAGTVPGPLRPNTALKVMTGAPIPEGADAVVPVEDAEVLPGGLVVLRARPKPGAHIRKQGEVIAAGQPLLAKGIELTPSRAAIAANAGRTRLRVVRRARASILVTGDEVVGSGEQPGPGQIRNTNGPLLLSAAMRLGCEVRDLGMARDDTSELRRILQEALDEGPDLLLTTGGVSAGDYDLVQVVLVELGVAVRFHKVALRPAKPLLFGTRGETLVFGLPGNPVSSAVAFDFFVRTAWRQMNGLTPAIPEPVQAFLAAPVSNRGARPALLPATFQIAKGRLLATPLATRGSHDLFTHSRASGYVRVEPETQLEDGDAVSAYPAGGHTTLG